MSTTNREQWLNIATESFRQGIFKTQGYAVPNVKISVGFPGGGSSLKRIGEHWSPEASDDNIGSIFINPIIADSSDALSILVHELVHASIGNKHGHNKVFKRCAHAVGLEGKMKSTVAGESLKSMFQEMIKTIGEYPHAKLNLSMSPKKKQKSRMIKMTCASCGYIARTSQTNIDDHGPVICPCSGEPMELT